MTTRNPFETRSPYEVLEHIRRERLAISIANFAMAFTIPLAVLVVIMFITQPSWQNLVTMILSIGVGPISYFFRYLVTRDKVDIGSYSFLFSMLLIIAVNATVTGGLFPMVAPGYVLVIVISGMLLGSRGRFTIAAVAAVMWIITQSIIARGFVPQTPLPDPIGTVSVQIIIALVFVFIGILSQLATSDLRRSLDEATYDLVQANRKLEEANRLKSQFMARTSHELRTPLSSIVAYSDLVLREAYGPLTPKQKDRVARVLQSARHLTTLINDLLNLAKIEAGELEIVETLFPVNDLAETVRSTLETAAREKELAFTVSLTPDMPEQIVGDQGRLCQVLINLATNAIKFTDEGSVTVSINPADENRWQMVVADTGPGIHEKHLQSIFDEFRQVNLSDTDKLRGVGLGLAITRQLVKLMAGEIHVTSELGKGSTFAVVLPLKAGAGK